MVERLAASRLSRWLGLSLVALLLAAGSVPWAGLLNRQWGLSAFLAALARPGEIAPAAGAGELEQAVTYLQRAQPGVDTGRALGLIALSQGDLTGAHRLLTERLARAPEDSLARYWLGQSQALAGDREAAVRAWLEAGASQAVTELARQLIATEAYSEALAVLEPLLQARPDDLIGRRLAGQVYQKQGHVQAALDQAQALIAARPQAPEGYLLAGDILLANQQVQEASQAYAAALQQRAEFGTLLKLGRTYLVMERWLEARRFFEAAIRERPDLPAGYAALADSYFRQQQYGPALNWYEQALAREETNPQPVLLRLGETLAGLDRWAEAAARYAQATEAKPDDPAAWVRLGEARCRLGQPAAAKEAYHQALALGHTGDPVRQAVEQLNQSGVCP